MAVTERPKYLYGVRLNDYGGQVEIGIFDPERWDGKGGLRFGYSVIVYIENGLTTLNRKPTVGVSIGGIVPHSPEDAELRIDCYRQGADIARLVRDELEAGQPWEKIVAFLTEILPTEPEHATENRFAVGRTL